MKRIIVITLSVLLCVSAVACGIDAPTTDTTSKTISNKNSKDTVTIESSIDEIDESNAESSVNSNNASSDEASSSTAGNEFNSEPDNSTGDITSNDVNLDSSTNSDNTEDEDTDNTSGDTSFDSNIPELSKEYAYTICSYAYTYILNELAGYQEVEYLNPAPFKEVPSVYGCSRYEGINTVDDLKNALKPYITKNSLDHYLEEGYYGSYIEENGKLWLFNTDYSLIDDFYFSYSNSDTLTRLSDSAYVYRIEYTNHDNEIKYFGYEFLYEDGAWKYNFKVKSAI